MASNKETQKQGRRISGIKRTFEQPNGRKIVTLKNGKIMPLARYLVLKYQGPIPDDHEVHHNNGDCTDDRIDLSNYSVWHKDYHKEFHATYLGE